MLPTVSGAPLLNDSSPPSVKPASVPMELPLPIVTFASAMISSVPPGKLIGSVWLTVPAPPVTSSRPGSLRRSA